ncbi:MAG TPA: ribbon-helix-helix protein, CopG family [Solirubrobacterales bacterium]|nr:ribbon-helix-helix protein, CopG family [Solirubrobacterales bacterium]
MNTKTTTMRLPESMAKQLAAIARAEGIPVSEIVREAIGDHIATRCLDEELKRQLSKLHQEDRDALKDLGIEA